MLTIQVVRMEALRETLAIRRAGTDACDIETGESLTNAIDHIDAYTMDVRLAHEAKVRAFRSTIRGPVSA